jgi:hypothetical protein
VVAGGAVLASAQFTLLKLPGVFTISYGGARRLATTCCVQSGVGAGPS